MTASRISRRSIAAPVLAAGLGVALSLGLGACSAGMNTQTGAQVAAVPGANVTVGAIALRNLLIAYDGPEGYPAGGTAPLIIRIFNEGARTVRLTGVSASADASSVALMGGTTVTPAPIPSPSPSASAAASATASATPTGSPSPTATETATPGGSTSPSPSPTATPTPTAAPTPTGQSQFSIEIPAQSYVLLVPGDGPYLQLVGLTKALTPGYSATVKFTFDDGSTAESKIPFAPAPEPVREGSVVHNENEK